MADRFTQRKASLEEKLTREDWQYIHFATEARFMKAAPRKGEPDFSKEFDEQRQRVMFFLQHMAFGQRGS